MNSQKPEPVRQSIRRSAGFGWSWLLLIVLTSTLTGVWLWHDYRATLDKAAVQQANVARLLEIHTSHVIANADAILDRVEDEVRDHDLMGQGADLRWPRFADMARQLPVSGRLWLYRADGSAVMASHMRHSTNNATDREYFTAQQVPGVGLFIGETVIGKTTGNKVFNLSRRIETADGTFAGVSMAAIDIDVFTQAVSDLQLGETAAYALLRSDGAVIMRHPDAGAASKRFSLKVLEAMKQAPAGLITAISAIDGKDRQAAYRTHASLPLAVVVSVARDEILAPWRQRATAITGALAVLLLVSGWLTVVARKATRREVSTMARMKTVLDTVAEGICGLNAQSQISFINPAGARMLGQRPDELVGRSFQDIAHHAQPDAPACTDCGCTILNLLHTQGEASGTGHFTHRLGHVLSTEYTATWVRDLDGQPGVVLAFRDVSALVAANHALCDQKEFLTSILDSLTEHVAVIDASGTITAVNAAWRRFAHANASTNASLPAVSEGTNYLEVCRQVQGTTSSDHAQSVCNGIEAVMTSKQDQFSLEYPCHSASEHRWFVMVCQPLQGKQQGAVIIHHDVTERKQQEMRLRASEEHFRLLAENMPDMVWKADADMRFTYINDADRRLRGFGRDEVIGHTIMDTLTPEGQAILQTLQAERQALEASGIRGRPLSHEFPQRCKDGSEIWIEVTTMPIYDTDGRISGFQGTGRDVTARKREEAQRMQESHRLKTQLEEAAARHIELQEKASRDQLTGLHNRGYLNETLPRELARGRREGMPIALIMLDLDHFKHVNDTHGHPAGDDVLRTLAALLRRETRESDLICRYGGEEFVVVMPGMGAEAAWPRVERWRTELASTVVRHGQADIRVTMSAGIVGFPDHGADMDSLLARADQMLYRAKTEGRNRVIVEGWQASQ